MIHFIGKFCIPSVVKSRISISLNFTSQKLLSRVVHESLVVLLLGKAYEVT